MRFMMMILGFAMLFVGLYLLLNNSALNMGVLGDLISIIFLVCFIAFSLTALFYKDDSYQKPKQVDEYMEYRKQIRNRIRRKREN